jgi:ankyrin repeat protein
MPDQPEFRDRKEVVRSSPPEKQPSLADQHWRALLPQRKRDLVEKDMLDAIETNNAWRFSMLMQLDKISWADNDTFLKRAIEHGRYEMFAAMAEKSPEWHRHTHMPGLASLAAESGRVDFVKLFVEKYEIDIHYYSEEMLRNAASKGHEQLVDYLLSKGADPKAWGGDPLRNAAENGHLGVVKKLVEAGADVNGGNGDPLDRAMRGGKVPVVEYLISKGADPRAGRDSALMSGCRAGQTAAVGALLAHGVPANAQDSDGLLACVDGKFFDTAKLLLEAGAGINAQGGKALRSAAYRGDEEAVRFLLDNKADPNAEGNRETPLTEAVRSGKRAIVELLVARGADPARQSFEAWKIARRGGKRDLQHALIDGARKHRSAEKLRRLSEFRTAFPGGYSLDDLRCRTLPSGDTGLLLAARTGKFAELVKAAKGGEVPRLEPADLFHPDNRLDSVLGVLHRNKDLQQFFEATLWTDRTDAVTRAFDSLPPSLQKRVSFDGLTAQINHNIIMKKAKDPAFKLAPSKIKPPKLGPN